MISDFYVRRTEKTFKCLEEKTVKELKHEFDLEMKTQNIWVAQS